MLYKIFNDYEEVKAAIGIGNVNNTLESVTPYFDTSVNDVLLTILGDALLDRLIPKAEENTLADEFEKKTWKLIQKVVAEYGYYLFSFDGSVTVTDMGITRMEDETSKSPYYNQLVDFRNNRLIQAYAALYKLAILLHQKQDSDWLADTSRLAYEKMLLWKMSDFSKVRKIQTWYTFFSLQWHLDHILESKIKPLIGDTKYTELVDEVKTGAAESAENASVLKQIRVALANLSIVEAAHEMNFKISTNGIEVVDVDTNSKNHRTHRVINEVEQQKLVNQAQKRGDSAICKIKEILEIETTINPFDNSDTGIPFFG